MDNKTCSRCSRALPRTEFSKMRKAKDGLQSYCKACSSAYVAERRAACAKTRNRHREAQRRFRERNPDYVNMKAAERYARRRELVDGYKRVPCADCGERYPTCCMDFDHVRGKKRFNIASGLSRSNKALIQEIGKCDVVCANCHRIRTFGGA